MSADLSEADLAQANLDRAILQFANLGRANLREASLLGANLRQADFTSADLTGADLSDANARDAVLDKARLRAAALFRTILHDAFLRGTHFEGAELGHTVFGDVDLSSADGLEGVVHRLPSTIGLGTLYASAGRIPQSFLRGIGIPDELIDYLQVARPEFYSCFISHSSKDARFCKSLHDDLQSHGIRTWYFPEDARWGERVWGQIDASIKTYDKLVVVCSKNSLRSGPVLREIERALIREDRECKNILFPIAIDRYVFDEWEHPRKADVLTKVVGDFTGWSRATKYAGALDRLLRDLKAETTVAPSKDA